MPYIDISKKIEIQPVVSGTMKDVKVGNSNYLENRKNF